MTKIKCQTCKYEWVARVKTPKKCPLCQAWVNKPEKIHAKKD